MEPIIRIRDLHYAYNEQKRALDGIDLDIYPGEKIAVIGSNGAGKSTFFLNLNGVLSPESGEIWYKDTLITKKNLNGTSLKFSRAYFSSRLDAFIGTPRRPFIHRLDSISLYHIPSGIPTGPRRFSALFPSRLPVFFQGTSRSFRSSGFRSAAKNPTNCTGDSIRIINFTPSI